MERVSIRDLLARQSASSSFRAGKKRRARLTLSIAAGAFAVMVVAASVLVVIRTSEIASSVPRIPGVFSGVGNRPSVPASERSAMTILVAGTDTRSPASSPAGAGFAPGAQRSDVLMLVHIDADKRHVSVVSIPRDSWVPIPGHGYAKINAALSWGGPPLMIRTVEKLTGVRIDHYAVLDFMGFEKVVQVLGGVQVEVAAPTSSGNVYFRKGLNDLNAAGALAYVRQRYGLPGSDLSRIQRQQNLIRAVLAKVASEHLATNPVTAYQLLASAGNVLSVDSTFSDTELVSLAVNLARLHGSDFTFLTAPVKGFGVQQGQDVLYLNKAECSTLWTAIRHDAVAAWGARHPSTLTPAVPH